MNRILAAVSVVAVLGAGTAVVMAGQESDPLTTAPRTPEVVATPTTTLSCPEAPATKQTRTTMLAVAPVGDASSSPVPDGSGQGVVAVVASKPERVLAKLRSRGPAASTELTPADQPSVEVRGTGSIAPGLAAAQWSTQQKDAGSGLAASLCQEPRDVWNFGGVSTAVGATSRLVLSNPTPAVAVFDLTFFGPDGVVDAVGARGLALAPQAQESLDLAQFAPGVDAMALNVTVDSGRVVAAVHTDLVVGNDVAGSEWIPASLEPATEVLVNPSHPEGTEQELQIANPTDREALVQVQLINQTGPFSPTQLQDVRVPPGTVATKPLTDIAGKDVVAVRMTSTTPVLGTLVGRSKKTDDFVMSSTSPVIADPAVVPLIEGVDLTMAFASQDRASGKVVIAAYADNGEEVEVTNLNFKGLTSKTWQPGKGVVRDASYIVVTLPTSLELHGVAYYDSRDGIASLPVTSGTYTLSKPSVQPATP